MNRPTPAVLPGRSPDEEVAAFFLEHRMAIRRYLIACGCPDHEADDMVQESIIAVRRYWDRVRGLEKPVAYWYKVASRKFWRARGAEQQRRDQLADPSDRLRALPEPADAIAAADRRAMLTALMRELPPRQRQVFWLRRADQFTTEETAEMLSVTAGTVKSQLHDAETRLRELAGKYGGEKSDGK